MPNPARSQSEFDEFFDRFLHALRKVDAIDELLDRFQSSAATVIEHGDVNANTTGWMLTGVKIGVNTNDEGVIFVRVTGVGPYTVSLYTAVAGSGLVAEGSGSAGAEIALWEQNNSGLSGVVTLGASPVADLTDNHRLRVLPGFGAFDKHVFDDDESLDAIMRRAHANANGQIADLLRQARSRALALIQDPSMLQYMASFLKSGSSSFLVRNVLSDDDQITLSVTGLLEDLREAMEDNTIAQSVRQTLLVAGPVTYDSNNQGLGTLSVGTIFAHVPPGRVIVTCINDAPPERFRVTLQPDDPFEPRRTGRNDLVVGRGWNDPDIAISLTLSRTFDKNGTDASNVDVAAASAVSSVDGISRENSNDGVLYGKVVANGANWDYEFYKASSRLAADLVAKATNIVAGAAFSATQQNNSGLTVTWQAGTAPTNGNTFELDCNLFSASAPADVMDFSVMRSSRGVIQDLVRKFLRWRLEQSGSPTINDGVVQRGGRFNVEVL